MAEVDNDPNDAGGAGAQPADAAANNVNTEDDSRAAHAASLRQKRVSAQLNRFAAVVIGLIFGCIHVYHASTLFENDRHFSHLSNLEREMSFRTEMGLYYSYYKRIVEAPTLYEGFMSIIHDNVTEHPDTINLFRRFNLVPEAVLGVSYRVYVEVMYYFNVPTRQCFTVERGNDRPPIQSCEGLGEPIFFYLEGVWLCAGLTAFAMFMYSYKLSNSLVGGCFAMLCFFYNHGECTRIQWAPALRESFAYPFVLAHGLAVTSKLDESDPHKRERPIYEPMMIGLTAYCMLLLWQFSQFILACEVAIFLVMYYIGNMERSTLKVLIIGLTGSQLLALTGLLANELLLTSFLSCILVVAWFNLLLQRKVERHSITLWSIFYLFLSAVLCIMLKKCIPSQDDAHIINILLSKVMSVKEDFHTLMYTCSPEFRRLPWSYLYSMFETGLIPLVITVLYCVFMMWLQRLAYYVNKFRPMRELFPPPAIQDLPVSFLKTATDTFDGPNGRRQKHLHSPKCAMNLFDPDIVFNMGLLIAYIIIASMIMRLKLFLTPLMCIFTSLLASEKVMRPIFRDKTHGPYHWALLVALVAILSLPGSLNLKRQYRIQGEYSNYPLEELLTWVETETPPDAVFAGTMPIMANLLLSTGRPIVNHPHYENAKLRERTKKVYSLFSRKSVEEVHRALEEMGVDYAVLEQGACLDYKRPITGCKMTDLWDAEDPDNRDQSVLCPQLFYNNPAPFHRVFGNSEYVVLAVKTYPLQLRRSLVSAPL